MQKTDKKTDIAKTFQDNETRERWEWVSAAINVAENDSMKALEARAQLSAEPAVSPFD